MLGTALLAALLVHVIVILGIQFNQPQGAPAEPTSMEVVFLDPEPTETPENADVLAAVDQSSAEATAEAVTGSPLASVGTLEQPIPGEQPLEAETPVVAEESPDPPQATVEPSATEARDATSEPEAPTRETTPSARDDTPNTDAESDRREAAPSTSAAALMRQGLTSARSNQNQTGFRRQADVRVLDSVNAKSAPEAAYLESWTRTVERIGNINYPAEARRRGLSGQLVVAARIRSDGTLIEARIQQSSNEPILDQAALEIVRLAAPFAAFPQSMRYEHDEIVIVRAWNFRRDRVF